MGGVDDLDRDVCAGEGGGSKGPGSQVQRVGSLRVRGVCVCV